MSGHVAQLGIRKARFEGAAPIAELSGQLGYPATVAAMQERLISLLHRPRYSAVFVAELAPNQVIGWLHVSVTPLLEVPLRAEVNGLVVAEGQRSAGAGAQLLQAAERWAKGQDCKSMSVRSNIIRDRAHAF